MRGTMVYNTEDYESNFVHEILLLNEFVRTNWIFEILGTVVERIKQNSKAPKAPITMLSIHL